jgi:hypothetical protein
MRKTFTLAALGALALSLAGCGSGGTALGSGTTGATGTTGTTGNGGTTTTTPVYSMGNGSGSSFQTGVIKLSSATLSAGGTSSLSVTIVDQTGVLYTGSVTVQFNSPCVAQGLAAITASGGATPGATSGSVLTTTGSANATYTAKGCTPSDVVTATATVGTSNLSATGAITVAAATVGSIQFVSASPINIGLKGTGIGETSTVIFKVLDSTGGPRGNATVAFALDSTVGGITLSPMTAVSAADGTVQTVVSSGTQHTSVRVSATIASPALSTESSLLTVSTGLPASDSFSIAVGAPSYAPSGLACPNVESYGIDGITVPITARLNDRYNNPAADGTAVAFESNGGQVGKACTTPSAPTAADGACTVLWTSTNPRPQTVDDSPPLKENGRATILATAIGEESFTDKNGNGYWDTGEAFKDLGEPYNDSNENGVYDAPEYFLDFNHDGQWNAGNGVFKGIQCTGTSCATTTLAISSSHLIIMSTSTAKIPVTSTPGFVAVGNVLTIKASTPAVAGSAGPPVVPPQPAVTYTGTINYTVEDLNNNPMAAGTTITVSADSAIGSIATSSASFTIGCATAVGGQALSATFTSSQSVGAAGNITITVTSPGTKSITTLQIPVQLN